MKNRKVRGRQSQFYVTHMCRRFFEIQTLFGQQGQNNFHVSRNGLRFPILQKKKRNLKIQLEMAPLNISVKAAKQELLMLHLNLTLYGIVFDILTKNMVCIVNKLPFNKWYIPQPISRWHCRQCGLAQLPSRRFLFRYQQYGIRE